jgi:hypothetical protein
MSMKCILIWTKFDIDISIWKHKKKLKFLIVTSSAQQCKAQIFYNIFIQGFKFQLVKEKPKFVTRVYN